MKFKELEVVKIATPLGLRFRDIVTLNPIWSGLSVKASPIDDPLKSVNAKPNGHGIYYFSHLPGLRDFEYSDEDLDLDKTPYTSPLPQFIIQVEDIENRFQSVAFLVSAPQQGIYPNSEPLGSPFTLSSYDLFSSPVRPTPAGFAEVRVDLKDSDTEEPAKYALLEVQTETGTYFGLSDTSGKAVTMFPYPPVEVALEGSPVLMGTRISLGYQTWQITIKVRYQPSAVQNFSELKKPNLRTILSQSHATITEFDSSPDSETVQVTLTYGRPLVLKSEGSSELHVISGGSP